MWPSWPQRCATPAFCERYGSLVLPSVMRSASMSARSAITRTEPVPAAAPVPVMSTVRPVDVHGRMSAASMPTSVVSSELSVALVPASSHPGSGCAWMCRRTAASTQ